MFLSCHHGMFLNSSVAAAGLANQTIFSMYAKHKMSGLYFTTHTQSESLNEYVDIAGQSSSPPDAGSVHGSLKKPSTTGNHYGIWVRIVCQFISLPSTRLVTIDINLELVRMVILGLRYYRRKGKVGLKTTRLENAPELEHCISRRRTQEKQYSCTSDRKTS
jgi:hypothetical protein